MGAEQAANVLTEVKMRQLAREARPLGEAEAAEIREPILAEYADKASAWHATSELWDDGILDPVPPRNAPGIAIPASLNAPLDDAAHIGLLAGQDVVGGTGGYGGL